MSVELKANDRRKQLEWKSIFDRKAVAQALHGEANADVDAIIRSAALNATKKDVCQPLSTDEWRKLLPHNTEGAVVKTLVNKKFTLFTLTPLDILNSANEDCTRIIFLLQDKLRTEACVMRFHNPSRSTDSPTDHSSGWEHSRATACLSCQVGCNMGCTFCATGTIPCEASLTSGEILEQLVWCNLIEREFRQSLDPATHAPATKKWIRNVVFMGMGEPLNNFEEVVRAIKQMVSDKCLQIASNRVTLSTVGPSIEKIKELGDRCLYFSLALSLHAPTQELRQKLLPKAAAATPIEDLLEACFEFLDKQRKDKSKRMKSQILFIEYCMIEGINDQPDHAMQLAELFARRKKDVTIDLIRYNPSTAVTMDYRRPSEESIEKFKAILIREGMRCFVRSERGSDINGACGQLALQKRTNDACHTEELNNISKEILSSHVDQSTFEKSGITTFPVECRLLELRKYEVSTEEPKEAKQICQSMNALGTETISNSEYQSGPQEEHDPKSKTAVHACKSDMSCHTQRSMPGQDVSKKRAATLPWTSPSHLMVAAGVATLMLGACVCSIYMHRRRKRAS